MSYSTTNKLVRAAVQAHGALAVFCKAPAIRDWLNANDPRALAQALEAVRAIGRAMDALEAETENVTSMLPEDD